MTDKKEASTPASEHELCDRFERTITTAVNTVPHLIWRGRNLSVACMIQIAGTGFLLRIENGLIQDCSRKIPLQTSWRFAVRGSAHAWSALWKNPPPPGWHDIFALSKRGEMVLEGDLHPLMANLQYFKDVLTLPRTHPGQ